MEVFKPIVKIFNRVVQGQTVNVVEASFTDAIAPAFAELVFYTLNETLKDAVLKRAMKQFYPIIQKRIEKYLCSDKFTKEVSENIKLECIKRFMK